MTVAGILRFGGWVKGVWGQADWLLRLDVDCSVGLADCGWVCVFGGDFVWTNLVVGG